MDFVEIRQLWDHNGIFDNPKLIENVVASVVGILFSILVTAILSVKAFPKLHRFLQYGKVAQDQKSKLGSWIDLAASATVPKAWFRHFYVAFAVLMWTQLAVFPQAVASGSKYSLVWAILTVQASRRAWESFKVTQWSSKSHMHVFHYLVGLAYYVLISTLSVTGLLTTKEKSSFRIADVVLIIIFGLCSVDQYQNHVHLARLVKYSVPTFRLFSMVSCAHYFDEISIYLVVVTLVFIHGPVTPIDWAFLASWVFVVVNLSVSALETHAYYRKKFEYKIKHAIVPYLL